MSKSKKLTKLGEEVIVSHIKELDFYGFLATLAGGRDMADILLRERSVALVGILWLSNFIARIRAVTMTTEDNT